MSTPYPVHEDNRTEIILNWDFGGGFIFIGSKVDEPFDRNEMVETTKLTEEQLIHIAADLLKPLFYYSPGEEQRILSTFMARLGES